MGVDVTIAGATVLLKFLATLSTMSPAELGRPAAGREIPESALPSVVMDIWTRVPATNILLLDAETVKISDEADSDHPPVKEICCSGNTLAIGTRAPQSSSPGTC
mmetsp:Transcript_53108/g.85967  ORF Transcript_53108/g.85967 Transcript_53108/m.85967 type:complete len:105 (-) Transcript_53108:4480-4794(-)